MDERTGWLAHRLDAVRTRRSTLGGGIGGLTALRFALGKVETSAKKKHKRKHKKKKKPPPSCAELCGADCSNCIFRADGPPLCGGFAMNCFQGCSSDQDCVSTDYSHPFCAIHHVKRETGESFDYCGPDGLCGECDPGAIGVCVAVYGCAS